MDRGCRVESRLAAVTSLQLWDVCEFILVFEDPEWKSTLQGRPGLALQACSATLAPEGLLMSTGMSEVIVLQ